MGTALSLYLCPPSLKAQAQLPWSCQGSGHPEAQKSNEREEGIGPKWDFCPPFPHPRPPSAKAWGFRL